MICESRIIDGRLKTVALYVSFRVWIRRQLFDRSAGGLDGSA